MKKFYSFGADRFGCTNSENAFSSLVIAGDKLYLSGMNGFDLDGNFHGEGDPRVQAEQACNNILKLLEENHLPVTSLCRMRVYVTDRDFRTAVYGAIGEKFAETSMSSTGLTVKALPLQKMLMQIDVEAHIE